MATIEDLQAELRVMSTELKTKMESMELRITERIKDVVKEQMTAMKAEITGRLDVMEDRVAVLEARPAPNTAVDDKLCNFVVYGLAENDEENVVEKVNNLILGQLKIENVRVTEAVRKEAFNNNGCGVIVAKCANIDDKKQVMAAKSKLRDAEHYNHVNIAHDKPKWQRQHESNMRLIVKTLGTNRLFVRGSRVCTSNDPLAWQNAANGRGRGQARGRGQTRGQGRGQGRGGRGARGGGGAAQAAQGRI